MVTFHEIDDAYHGRGAYEGDGRARILVDMAAAEWRAHERCEGLVREAKLSNDQCARLQYASASMRHYETWSTLCTAISVFLDPDAYSHDYDDAVLEYTSALDLDNGSDEED